MRTADRLILFIMSGYLLLDTVNGILMREVGWTTLTISQIAKVLLIVLMLYSVSSGRQLALFGMLTVFLGLTLAHFYMDDRFGTKLLIKDLNITLKMLLVPAGFLYFQDLSRRTPNWEDLISKILLTNFLIMVGNLVCGAVGLGYTQYRGAVGTVGFFYAGNEVSGTLVLLSAFAMFVVYRKYSLQIYVVFFFCLLLLGVIKATKTSIFGIASLGVLIPFIYFATRRFLASGKELRFFTSLLLLFPIFIAFMYRAIVSIGLLDRWEYFFRNRNLLSFLLSDREIFFGHAWKAYIEDYTLIQKILGTGYQLYPTYIGKYFGSYKTVEIDFMDFLMIDGLLGLIFVFIVSVVGLYIAIQATLRGLRYGLFLLMLNFLLIFIANTAGHIFLSGMLGIFIGMINVLALSKRPLEENG